MSGLQATPTIDHAYEEWVSLPDGRRGLIRLMRPSDRVLLVNGFERMSPQSRYRRFFSAKPRLSDREISYLTELDHHDHVAVVLVAVDDRGEPLGPGAGLGVARFIRLRDTPHVAEAAIVILDEVQGSGFGRLLFQRLAQAASERQVLRFRTEVLAQNNAMKALLQRTAHDLGSTLRHHYEGPVFVSEFALGPPIEPTPDAGELDEQSEDSQSHLYDLLRFAAMRFPAATRLMVETLEWLDVLDEDDPEIREAARLMGFEDDD